MEGEDQQACFWRKIISCVSLQKIFTPGFGERFLWGTRWDNKNSHFELWGWKIELSKCKAKVFSCSIPVFRAQEFKFSKTHYTPLWDDLGFFLLLIPDHISSRPSFVSFQSCQISSDQSTEGKMEHGASWRFSGFFCFSWTGEVADLLFQYQLKITKAGWAGYFFLAGIQEKVRMIRCNFSCNWVGTIWIWIGKGLNKQMVDVIYSNPFFFVIATSSNSAPRSSSFFPGDFANWWIQKRHLLRWGQFP